MAAAAELDAFVRIDMEDHTKTDATLGPLARDPGASTRRPGSCIQAALRRSGGRRRSRSSPRAAGPPLQGRLQGAGVGRLSGTRSRWTATMPTLMERLLRDGEYPALATHDERLIDRADRVRSPRTASSRNASSSRCSTASGATCRSACWRHGYRVRVYVPFGARVVPVLHAPPGRTPGQRPLPAPQPPPRRARQARLGFGDVGPISRCVTAPAPVAPARGAAASPRRWRRRARGR